MRIHNSIEWTSVPLRRSRKTPVVHRVLGPLLSDRTRPGYAAPCDVSTARLPSHPDVLLVRVTFASPAGARRTGYAFCGPQFVHYVDGCAQDVYALNLHAPWTGPARDTQQAAALLALFLECARGQCGWRLVRSATDLCWLEGAAISERNQLLNHIRPIDIAPPDTLNRVRCRYTVQSAGRLSRREAMLWPDGFVTPLAGEEVLYESSRLARPDDCVPFHAACVATDGSIASGKTAAPPYRGTWFLPSNRDGELDSAMSALELRNRSMPRGQRHAEIMSIIAKLLCDDMIDGRHRISPTQIRGAPLLDRMARERPFTLVLTPYLGLAEALAGHLGTRLRRSVCLTFAHQPLEESSRLPHEDQPTELILLTAASFENPQDTESAGLARRFVPLLHCSHHVVVIAESVSSLPREARDLVDLTLAIPAMTEDQFRRCTTAALLTRVRLPVKRDFIRYVQPRDIARAAACVDSVSAYFSALREAIERRLAQYLPPPGFRLDELPGLRTARHRIRELTDDVRSALRGTLPWSEVDRGLLLVGPPGTGKTTLARAMANECGIRFMVASASAWQECAHLGFHIKNIRETFREARAYAPCIVFIDELDSLGNRSSVEAHNSQYQREVINTVLEELDGFSPRTGVIVVGASNALAFIDPALRRPGRLDRVIELEQPSAEELAEIYRFYLARLEQIGMAADAGTRLDRIAQIGLGASPAEVEFHVRAAARAARRAGRTRVTERDLRDEILHHAPVEVAEAMPAELRHRVAVHEAGHALAQIVGGSKGRVGMVSIRPGAAGTLGFTSKVMVSSDAPTRASLEESVRVYLAGRAAEELVLGAGDISTGAGADLERATGLTFDLLTRFGYSDSLGLLSPGDGSGAQTGWLNDAGLRHRIVLEARATLERLYDEIRARLATHRTQLLAIVQILLERDEVSMEDLELEMARGRASLVSSLPVAHTPHMGSAGRLEHDEEEC